MVRIVTDTTACLHPETARKYGIPVIPQVINFGNDSFLEGIDIDIPTFMAKLKASAELPKTAAPPPELFVEQFQKITLHGEPVLCIHPSIHVSGTVRSAQIAAAEFPGADIHVMDTGFVASPLATMVERAAEWAAAGEDIGTIRARLDEMIPRCRIYFLVATLEYLAKGGRIGGAAALLGSLLQIKPILTFQDGRVNQFEKERTHKQALARLKELAAAQIASTKEGYLTVMHAGAPEQGHALAEELCARLRLTTVPVHDMPPAIVTHGGPGVLGVGFFTD